MIMIDTHGTVLQYNECAVQSFGYSKEEVSRQQHVIIRPLDRWTTPHARRPTFVALSPHGRQT